MNIIKHYNNSTLKLICVFGIQTHEDVIYITRDDKVYGFGENKHKCLGLGNITNTSYPAIIEELCDQQIKALSFGDLHVLALTENGRLYSWGSNNFGELGYKTIVNEYKPKIIESLQQNVITNICCGSHHSIALTNDFKVFIWGYNECGHLGNGYISHITSYYIPITIKTFNNNPIKSIAAGNKHSLALTECGHVFSWGNNNEGQLGRKMEWEKEICYIPGVINTENIGPINKIACGYEHSLLLANSGYIYAFGSNFYGQIGKGDNSKSFYGLPNRVEFSEVFIDIATIYSRNISVGLSTTGKVYVWGQYKKNTIHRFAIETRFESIVDMFVDLFEAKKTIQYVENLNNENSALQMNDVIVPDNHISSRTEDANPIHYNNDDFSENSIESEINTSQASTIVETENAMQSKKHNKNVIPECFVTNKKPQQQTFERNNSIITMRYNNEYEELDLLGGGGFAKVFKAHNIIDDNIYAIKKIELKGLADIQVENYLKECRILAKLECDYIIRYNSSWIENHVDSDSIKYAVHYIQMELCEYTLENVIEIINTELNQNEHHNIFTRVGYYISSALFEEILKGVDYLHNQNPPIIHRDLKPKNILISNGSSGRFVRIADFGISTLHTVDISSHTKGVGTSRYIAHEVLNGGQYDTKADIYSLGVIMQDLFNIDINDLESEFENLDPMLKNNISKISKLIENTMNIKLSVRKSCGQILEEKHLWALDVNVVKDDNELNTNENSFTKKFINTKLKYI